MESWKESKRITVQCSHLQVGRLRPDMGRELPKAPQQTESLLLALPTPRGLRVGRRAGGPVLTGRTPPGWSPPSPAGFQSGWGTRLWARTACPGSSPFRTRSPRSAASSASHRGRVPKPSPCPAPEGLGGRYHSCSISSAWNRPEASGAAGLPCPLVATEGNAFRNPVNPGACKLGVWP